MLLDAIIEPMSDFSTMAGQWVAQYIADHSSLPRDGWFITCVRFLVATVAFLVVGVGAAALVSVLVWWLAWKTLFEPLFA